MIEIKRLYRRIKWYLQKWFKPDWRHVSPYVDFHCIMCDEDCNIVPPTGIGICTNCCEDHEFEYDRDNRDYRCIFCDELAPDDYYRYDGD